jgi:hypothetical protein
MKATTSKYLTRHLTLLAAIALAPCALANVLVESFETSVFPGSNPPYTTIAQSSAAGVTDGTYSMQVAFDNSGTWSWMEGNYGATTYSDWQSHYKLQFDLHRAAESFGWNLNLAVAINGPQGWHQVESVAWDWHNAGQSSSQTITWDYSAIQSGAPVSGTWWQMSLMARGSYGGTIYIDNVRFIDPIPEPAAAGLLMLGAGLLIAARRRQF